jgi:tetratricopeptide (TPR) repeat protein
MEERLGANPDSLVFSRLADYYLHNDEIDRAIETCKRGVMLHPDNTTGRIVLGRCYMRQERWKEAIDAFTEVCRLDSRNSMAIKLLGDLFARRGSSAPAGDLYRLVAAMDPFDAKMAAVAARVNGPEKTELFDILADAEKTAEAVVSTGKSGEKNGGAFSDIPETITTPTENQLRQNAGATPSDARDSGVEELSIEPEIVKAALPADGKTNESAAGEQARAEARVSATESSENPNESETSFRIDIVTPTLAEIYFKQGRLQRALAIYRSLLNRDPENDHFKKSIEAVNAAIASGKEGMPAAEQERGKASRKITEEPAQASFSAGSRAPEPVSERGPRAE